MFHHIRSIWYKITENVKIVTKIHCVIVLVSILLKHAASLIHIYLEYPRTQNKSRLSPFRIKNDSKLKDFISILSLNRSIYRFRYYNLGRATSISKRSYIVIYTISTWQIKSSAKFDNQEEAKAYIWTKLFEKTFIKNNYIKKEFIVLILPLSLCCFERFPSQLHQDGHWHS